MTGAGVTLVATTCVAVGVVEAIGAALAGAAGVSTGAVGVLGTGRRSE